MNPLEKLRADLAQVAGEMANLTAAVQAENRAMTDEEDKKFKAFDAQVSQIEASITNMERNEALQARLSKPTARIVETQPNAGGAATTTTPLPAAGYTAVTGHIVAHNFSNHGFTRGSAEFYAKVREAAVSQRVDPRLLVNSVSTWAGEAVPADGGFALPPQFTQGIMSLVAPPDSFLRALNAFPTQSDIITIPKDEDAPWSTTAVTAAKTAEGVAITPSKAVVSQLKVPMYGVKSLVHVDEKSLRDMAFLGAYIERKMGEKIRWKVENYVMNGTGDNEPLGIVNAPGLLSISASDGTSTAALFSAYDIGLMEASALLGSGGFWLGHPLIKAQLRVLSNGTAGVPLYQSDFRTGMAVDSLIGYPYYSSEAAKAYGTPCDLTFVRPDGYFLAFEQAGPQNATTVAFAFDQNLQSFRSTLYMGGSPTLSSTVLRADGTHYASNLVTLAGSRS